MPFSIVRDDIARVSADAVVNAANPRLKAGGGVCGSLFAAAGAADMQAACDAIGGCPTGSAVATPAFALDAKWCIHAVGPVWNGGVSGEREALRSCYRALFAKVIRLGARSVAFPLISAGIYGFPAGQALAIAREETESFLREHDDVEATLVVFDRAVLRAGNALFEEIAEYIDDEYVDSSPYARGRSRRLDGCGADLDAAALAAEEVGGAELGAATADAADVAAGSAFGAVSAAAPMAAEAADEPLILKAPSALASLWRRGKARGEGADRGRPEAAAAPQELDDLLDNLDASFSETVLALIDERGLADSEVYHRANLSRQLFSKIRSNRAYRPTKPTAVALAVALRLSVSQTQDLLARAGFTLSRSSKFDVIVRFFLERRIYDVFQINEALFAYDQPLLGSAG